MKEKKQAEAETKIKSADKQIEAKSFPSQGLPERGLVGWMVFDCLGVGQRSMYFEISTDNMKPYF